MVAGADVVVTAAAAVVVAPAAVEPVEPDVTTVWLDPQAANTTAEKEITAPTIRLFIDTPICKCNEKDTASPQLPPSVKHTIADYS